MKKYTIILFTLVYVSFQNFAQGTPGDVGSITSINSYTTFQGYDESAAYLGQGEYQIFYDNIDGNFDKPLIICDGFDPEDSRDITSLYNLGNYGTGNFFDDLRNNEGSDIILLNFPNYTRAEDGATINGGADYIERNGLVLVNLIETIKDDIQGANKIVVIGPSMGGLITRYALTYMEDSGLDHETGIWLSFDSPQKGANVPISFQYAVNYFAEYLGDADMAALRDVQLNSPAAKQMLLDHYSSHLQEGHSYFQDTSIQLPTPNSYRTTFMSTMDALGFPQQTMNLALVNGSLAGSMVESPGAVLMDGVIDPDGVGAADVSLHFTPDVNTSNFNVDHIVVSAFGVPINTFDAVAESPSYTAGLDSAPGGTVLFDSYFGATPTALEQQVIDALQVDAFSFIPTLSSLVIEDQNWYSPVSSSETTLYDAYFGPTENEPHLTLSIEGKGFIMDHLSTFYLSTVDYLAMDGIKLLNNPVKDNIKIQLDSKYSFDSISMKLYSITGQINQETHLLDPQGVITLPRPSISGLYILHITDGTNLVVKKVLVQ